MAWPKGWHSGERWCDMAFLTATIRDDNGVAVGVVILAEKTFGSGSRGFFGQAKLEMAGVRYQAQVQAVEIHSKESPVVALEADHAQ